MKKLTLPLLAGLALITAGCSNDETVEVPKGQAIAFENSFVNKTGRAVDELTANNLKLFKVWGFSSTAAEYIFNGQEVTVTGIQSSYDPPRYWSANTTYNFMAITTPNMTADANITAENPRSWTYEPGTTPDAGEKGYFGTLTFDNAISNGLEDLAFAGATRTTGATISTSEEAVKLSFNHALSRVRFYFRNNMPEGYYIEVKNIELKSLPQQGSLDFKTLVWTTTGSYSKGLVWDTPASVGAGEEDYIAPTKYNSTEPVYTLPTKAKFTIGFEINVYMKEGENYICMNGATPYKHNVDIEIKQDAADPTLVTGLEMGTAYGFTARITDQNIVPGGLKEIEFSTSIVPFDTSNPVSSIIETPTTSSEQEENV